MVIDAHPRRPGLTRPLAIAFWACSAVHLVLVAADVAPYDSLTKGLPMPLLAAWVVARGGPSPLVAALLLSWGGDVALEADGLFVAGMASFGAAHVCYVTWFVRRGALAALRRRPLVPVLYGVVWLGLVVLLWPGLGVLRVPVAGYSLLLTATAVTAAGLGWRTGIGGALFLFSDALIALDLAGLPRPPYGDVIVMVTYLAAQYLLASGIIRPSRPSP